ncbi:MFS transporter [Actinoplanes regularis]|uniref:Drug resistance transporter, EmrB/QacA subfamily n=1 Tax=Actinoplanes regularis TaxID=52697 RepID=A0A238W239_9ACTN|nr:MFS transporter [Actinoplanes regularis]GIE85333.1 MFS transporter [Actinoplanes regularis]SNR40568.1 drug resistance transporter, EmrB/QacA subfamily [Actinoplanes regularis]
MTLTSTRNASTTRGRGLLLTVLTGVFITTLDFFIVNVAIPSAQSDLSAGPAQIQWVVAGFGLAYGVGLITGGRLGDLYGRRRMFTLGLALFTLASLACGIAPDAGFLVGARVAQGVSAALLAPQVLAILRTGYTGPALARAFSAYGLTMGVAAVFGQLIGGLLIEVDLFGWGWRGCFLINIPIGLITLACAPRFVPESRAPGRPRLDPAGMLLITLALLAVVLPLIEGRELGWPLWTELSFAAAAGLFALFAMVESRVAARRGSPLIAPSIFRDRAFLVGLLAQLVFWMGQGSFFLIFALYVQRGRGLDALGAGVIFVAIGVGYLVTSTNAHRFAARLGRQVLAVGGLTMVAGLLLLAVAVGRIGVGGTVWWLVPGLMLDGAGMGLVVGPITATVLMRVAPHHAGAAGGLLATALQIGNAVGVSIIGVIFYGVLGETPSPAGFADAFSAGLVCLIGVGTTLALLTQLLPKSVRA